MSELDLDLNINNYTVSDLKTFFRIDPNKIYSVPDIDTISYNYREAFLKSGSISPAFVRDFMIFIDLAKHKLIDAISTLSSPTSIYYPPTKNDNIDTPVEVIYPDASVREQDIQDVNRSIAIVPRQSLCVPIDTRFRKSPYTVSSSNWSLSLPNKINRAVSMRLASFELSSYNMYNIYQSMGNNYINIIINHDQKYTVIVPDGHYNTTSLVLVINSELHKDKCSLLFFINIELESVVTNKTVIYSTNSEAIQSFSLDFSLDINGNSDTQNNEYFLKLGRVLGYTRRKYYHENIIVGETQVNPNLCVTYFYLSINDYNNNHNALFISPFEVIQFPTTILSKISIEHKFDGAYTIKFTDEERLYHGPVDLTNLQIQILDAHGKIVQLNNMDYSFTLLFKYMYKSS